MSVTSKTEVRRDINTMIVTLLCCYSLHGYGCLKKALQERIGTLFVFKSICCLACWKEGSCKDMKLKRQGCSQHQTQAVMSSIAPSIECTTAQWSAPEQMVAEDTWKQQHTGHEPAQNWK